jgi:hypothetical protein
VDSEGTEVEGADPATAAAETGKPERDKVQERFDKLTREKYEGLSRAERAEYRAQLAEQRLADIEARQAAKPEPVAQVEDYPSLESVGYDEDKHRAAVATWSAKQAREAARAEIAAERTAAQRDQLERDWERKQDDFIKSKPDYADKVGKLPPSLMPDALAAEIKETGNPEIAYYLAENLDKLAEIARLPPKAQAREIGRIEARLEAAKAAPPPVSKAPAPPSRIDGNESAAVVKVDSAESDKLSDAEWTRRRNAQELARRRARNG